MANQTTLSTPATPATPATPLPYGVYIATFVVALIVALAVTCLGSNPKSSTLDVAAVTLLATTAAVVIERLLEFLWTIVGLKLGSFWPLHEVNAQVDALIEDLNRSLGAYNAQAQRAVDVLRSTGAFSKTVADAAKQEIGQLDTAAANLANVAHDKGQIGAFASAAAQHLGYLDAKYGLLLSAAEKDRLNVADPNIDADIAKVRAVARANALIPPPSGGSISAAEADRLADIAAAAEAQRLYVARIKSSVRQQFPREAEYQGALAGFVAALATARSAAVQTAQVNQSPADEQQAAGDWAEANLARQYIFADDATQLGAKINVAVKALGGVTDFLASFKDNPGRRLLSLGLASLLGLVVAGSFKLDVFSAILAPSGFTAPVEFWRTPLFDVTTFGIHPGVVLTGLLLGLGSAPTHEVIRVLQEYKEGQKRGNAPETIPPTVATTTTVPTIR